MTIEEKRKWLNNFCDDHLICEVGACPLHIDEFQCGRGKHFISPPGTSGYMTDDEINAAFDAIPVGPGPSHKSENKSENTTEKFKRISKDEVWSFLQNGKPVFAIVLQSDIFWEGIKDLTVGWDVNDIIRLLKEPNVEYYLKTEKEEN